MIHGGGHLTLSRRAVRPTQTKYLLSQGILPVSIDYRLCPQVNVIDGPVADTRDACEWAQRDLPKIMASRNIEVDASKLIVIGWSTGGTLAMTTAWTLPSAGLPPPVAILSFYCPVNYDPEAPIQMGEEHEKRNMSLSEIRRLLGPQPVSVPGSIKLPLANNFQGYQPRFAYHRHNQAWLGAGERPTLRARASLDQGAARHVPTVQRTSSNG